LIDTFVESKVLEGWGEDEDEAGLMQAMRAHEDSLLGGEAGPPNHQRGERGSTLNPKP